MSNGWIEDEGPGERPRGKSGDGRFHIKKAAKKKTAKRKKRNGKPRPSTKTKSSKKTTKKGKK
jgi:hypothetical protein